MNLMPEPFSSQFLGESALSRNPYRQDVRPTFKSDFMQRQLTPEQKAISRDFKSDLIVTPPSTSAIRRIQKIKKILSPTSRIDLAATENLIVGTIVSGEFDGLPLAKRAEKLRQLVKYREKSAVKMRIWLLNTEEGKAREDRYRSIAKKFSSG